MSDHATFTYLSLIRQEDETKSSFRADSSKAGILSLCDPQSQSRFEIRQENGRLSYFIVMSNNEETMLHDCVLPPLLRQFSNLHQFKGFLMNQNLIRMKKYKAEFRLELSLCCRGGFPFIPIFIFLASAGITWAADRWIIRPYLIEPLKAKINGSEMGSTVKTVACYALEGVDFALMVLLGGAIDAAASKLLVSHTMTKCAEKTAELLGKQVFEKEGIQAGLTYFQKFTMGLRDILELSPNVTELAIKHSLNEATIKEALTSIFYHLGKSLPRMIVPATIIKSTDTSKVEEEAKVADAEAVQNALILIVDGIELQRRDERMQRLMPAYNFYRRWKRQDRAIDDVLLESIVTACDITSDQASLILEELEARFADGIPENINEPEDLNWLGGLSFP